jgi:anti-sigma regulatory factor (Ser/Thr protein kinase)
MTRHLPREHMLDIPAAVQALHQIRVFIDAIIQEAGLDEAERAAFELAVTEVVSNAIRHGSPQGAEDRVTLNVVEEETRIVVTIRDHGVGFVPERITLPDPHTFADHGRGLYLIHALADEVEYSRTDGTTVRLVKKKKAAIPEPLHRSQES